MKKHPSASPLHQSCQEPLRHWCSAYLAKTFRQAITYVIVGSVIFLSYSTAIVTQIDLFHFDPRIANVAALLLSGTMNYLCHRKLTFGISGAHVPHLVRFAVVFVTIVITTTGIWQAVHAGIISQWIAVTIIFILIPAQSFLVMKFWIFLSPNDVEPPTPHS